MRRTGEILRLLAAINDQRRTDLSLAAIARLANRSPFSLHRQFRKVVGDSPKRYVSRVRLARAAAALLSSRRSAARVAADHGYASPEVFSRAFVRLFGLSPGAYRARGLNVDDSRCVDLHSTTVVSVAPCVGLYRLSTQERAAAMAVDIAVKDLPNTHAIVLRRRAGQAQVAATLAECLPRLFDYATRHGLAMSGPPFTRYLEIGMGSVLIEAGIQLAAPASLALEDDIEALTIPAGPAAMAIHYGPYDTLPETYQAIESWIRNEGRTIAGPLWEVYLTDPGERPDPRTWETQIVQPVA